MNIINRFAAVTLGLAAPCLPIEPVGAQEFPDQQLYGNVLVDLLEYRGGRGRGAFTFDGQAWYGSDYDKIWIKSQGNYDRNSNRVDSAEVQVLYSRLLSYYFDFQVGVRRDFKPNPSRTYGVIGIQGLAPGFFEIDTQAFVSETGDVSGRFTGAYDLLITNRLILQPRAEINAAVQRVPELSTGSGITSFDVGARLRYEFRREFAPYIGVSWERKLGETSAIAKRQGQAQSTVSFVGGVRFWF